MSDTIYRDDAIRVANGFCHPANIAKELAQLPTAQPERKRGKWIIEDPKRGVWTHIYYCSECGNGVLSCEVDKPNFCSNCGADMRGEK